MEKRVLGIILTLLGIVGLIMAAVNFINHTGSTQGIKMVIVYGALGVVFFFSGVGLIRSSKDVLRSNERVS